MDLSRTFRTAKSVITANSPVLLVAASITGIVTTGVLAAKGGYKARGIIDDERMRQIASPEPPFDTFLEYKDEFYEKTTDLPLAEKVKLTWLCYATPAITGASAIASVVGVHAIHTKRYAAMAGLYALTSTKLDDVREKTEELLSGKKVQELRESVAQSAVDRNPPGQHEVILIEGGNELMYDEWSGRYVMGSVPILEKAVADVNLRLAESGECSLNEFYDNMGMSPLPMGLDFGWVGPGRITAHTVPVKTKDGRAAIAFSVADAPTAHPGRFH